MKEGVYRLAREMAWYAGDTCFLEVLKWDGKGERPDDANERAGAWLRRATRDYEAGVRPWAA